ncbi:MAG: RecBCD enzyme subunit RecD [Candidatus Anoxychlamydiales bacterium]|nr:RecBCD enzyme subunit RecD [Candidatus Anoxychlamydiales bacterium]
MFGQIDKELNFSYFEDLRKKEFFSYLDEFFAKYLKPQNEVETIFLAYLFLISKNGYISLEIQKDTIYPLPKFFNVDSFLQIDEKKLIEKIILGSDSFSKKVLSFGEDKNFQKSIVCRYENFFYLQKNFVFETKIIKNVKELLLSRPKELFVEETFTTLLENEKTLNAEQKKAIQNFFKNSISFILGGPGTGKTYTAAHLIDIFYKSFDSTKKEKLKIVATAFTGKATSHLKSNISKFSKDIEIDAKTLHSLLNIKEGRSKFFEGDKLCYDLIIIDESSMLDLKIIAHLLDSIKKDSRVVFIGDPNQIPPIESGNIFAELSKSNKIPKITLKRAVRFENSNILDIADLINLKNEKAFEDIFAKKDLFYDLEKTNQTKKDLLNMAKTNFSLSKDEESIDNIFAKINNFKILSSLKKGPFGVDLLNHEIFSLLYNDLDLNHHLYVPIIITKNSHKLELYNGQIGILQIQKTINGPIKKQIYFQKDDKKIQTFSIYLINYYEYAYSISIHKSQGSEFNDVCIILPEGSINFGKELFYTAVTRAKKDICLFSTKKILKDLIKVSSFKKSAILNRLI